MHADVTRHDTRSPERIYFTRRQYTCMACGPYAAGSCATFPVRAINYARHAQLQRAPGCVLTPWFCAGPVPAWFLGSIPFIRKHGGAALAHQAMSKVYGPVWVSHGGVQPFVITVCTKHVIPVLSGKPRWNRRVCLLGKPDRKPTTV